MTTSDYPRPVSDPEAEGLPATADDDSLANLDEEGSRWADGVDPAALPADEPSAAERYGSTPAEEAAGESLSARLAEEEPDVTPDDVPIDRGLDADEDVGRTGGSDDAGDAAEAEEIGTDLGDIPAEDRAMVDEPPVEPNLDSQVSMYDRPDGEEQVGRLVAPDNGIDIAEDTESDEFATDVGMDSGGASAEETAVHAEPNQ